MLRFWSLGIRRQCWFLQAWCLYAYWHTKIAFSQFETWNAELFLQQEQGEAAHVPKQLIETIEMAGRHHIKKMNCLRRCLVTKSLLQQYGVTPKLHFGVRFVGKNFEAHCWLTANGVLLNDSADNVNTYSELKRWQAINILSKS